MAVSPKDLREREEADLDLVDRLEAAIDAELKCKHAAPSESRRTVEIIYDRMLVDCGVADGLSLPNRRALVRRYREAGWGRGVKAFEKMIIFTYRATRG